MSVPSFQMPANACNSHLHIIDPSFPNDGKAVSQIGTVETYQALSREFSLPRAIFVQAKPFALDNSCLIDAISRFGSENCRGIAVANNSVSDKALSHFHESGIRGLRFSVWNPANAVVSFEDCKPLSERIAEMGWNIQLHMSAGQLVAHADTIRSLRCKVVIDHMGRLDPAAGLADPAYSFLCELLDKGNTYIKLSGPYLNTASGRPWHDATRVAIALAEFAPERVVWGSDFPHVTEAIKPDALSLIDLIPVWLPSEKARQLALVDNPARLYGF